MKEIHAKRQTTHAVSFTIDGSHNQYIEPYNNTWLLYILTQSIPQWQETSITRDNYVNMTYVWLRYRTQSFFLLQQHEQTTSLFMWAHVLLHCSFRVHSKRTGVDQSYHFICRIVVVMHPIWMMLQRIRVFLMHLWGIRLILSEKIFI